MTWVVDTCMVIDILENDPTFGRSSAEWLDGHAEDGLVISPMTYTELAPAFRGGRDLEEEFLGGVGIQFREPWTFEDTVAAHAAWNSHVTSRRAEAGPKRPLADVLIGSFALRFQGLITRNPDDFRSTFRELELSVPAEP